MKAEQVAMNEKVSAADTRSVEATEALRAQKEAEMTVDMTVRAYAIKEQEALDAAKAASLAADKQAAAERERDGAVAEAARLTAERDTAKQSEANALASKAAMQNELYAAQIRIENLARALAARSSVPYTPATALRPTPVVTEEPVAAAADTAQPPAATAPAAPAGPRTHTVAEGESLSLIAFKYYQSPNKWDKIVAANRTKLKNPDMLRPGMVLIIP
jgi:nucleoid-associated protein YgaU